MASEFFQPTSSQTTTKIISQTEAAKVESVSGYTKPSHVQMVVEVPYAAFVGGNAEKYYDPPAMLTEQLMGNDLGVEGPVTPIVTGARQVQDTDPATKLLTYYMVFTVSYQPESSFLPYTQDVRVPMSALSTLAAFSQPIDGGKTAQQLLLDAHAQLVKLAGG